MRVLAASAVAAAGGVLAARLRRRRRRMDFAGCSVVVTGGSRGLGLEMARRFAREGARLTLLARDEEELERAVRELRSGGADVQAFACDVGREEEVRRAVDRVLETCARIDVLDNNAGIIPVGPVEHMTTEDFEGAMAVHLWGPLHGIRAVAPVMKRQGGGRIVNISSIGGQVAVPHLLPYSASKFALTGLSDGFRAELAKDGIRVTTVCPGLMRTGSHVNAWFKGRRRKEFSWFSLSNAFPLDSMHPERAARKIVDACRYGDAHLTLTLPARLLVTVNTLLPNVTAGLMKLADRMLPSPCARGGDERRRGWESRSAWSPSPLTRPADRQVVPNNERPSYPTTGAGT